VAQVEVRTQAELDQAVANGDFAVCVGDGHFTVRGSSSVVARESSSVEAWGSSSVVARESSSVEAWESSSVVAWGSSRVEARGSSSVEAWGSSSVVAWGSSSVEAWGSSSVEAWESSSVVAWGSSSVVARGSSRVVARESSRVEAWGSSRVEAWGSSRVEAAAYVAVHDFGPSHGTPTNINGGVIITLPKLDTAETWLEFHGVKTEDGIAVLYKAVRDDWRSYHRMSYEPGSTPEAPDWDPVPECGGGLHFASHPSAAKSFDPDATRFVACPVRVDQIVVHWPADYGDKVKAPRVVAPGCWEVDKHGARIEQTDVAQ
jgi:hypothetical protein